MFNFKAAGLAVVGAAAVSIMPVGNAQAAQLVMDFSNNVGLGYGDGTTQTITQNGIQMKSTAGSYEIRESPYPTALNLKDYTGSTGTRAVAFSLTSGLNFDFLGFVDAPDGSFGNVTIASNRGGSITFNPYNQGAQDFSSSVWKKH